MSKKRIRNRLDTLFAELEQETISPQLDVPPASPTAVEVLPVPTPPPGENGKTALRPTPAPAPSSRLPLDLSRLGFRAAEDQILPADGALTPLGPESLRTGELLARPAQAGDPAMMALAQPVEAGRGRLLLEFLDTDPDREWSEDERLLVEQVTDQLTLALENANLFARTQEALSETETLYQAGAELNSADVYEDILAVLRKYTILGHDYVTTISIGLFDRAWTETDQPDWFTPVVRWTGPTGQGSKYSRYPLKGWAGAKQALSPDNPTLIFDAESDPSMEGMAREVYVEHLQAKSLLFVPLNVAGRWVGHIVATFSQRTAISERDLRRLSSLAGQAAVAVYNLRQVQEIQARAHYEHLIREIGSQISSSIDMETVVKSTARSIGQALGASHVVVRMQPKPGQQPDR